MPMVADHNVDVATFVRTFKQALEKELDKQITDKSPNSLYKACKVAIKSANFPTYYNDNMA